MTSLSKRLESITDSVKDPLKFFDRAKTLATIVGSGIIMIASSMGLANSPISYLESKIPNNFWNYTQYSKLLTSDTNLDSALFEKFSRLGIIPNICFGVDNNYSLQRDTEVSDSSSQSLSKSQTKSQNNTISNSSNYNINVSLNDIGIQSGIKVSNSYQGGSEKSKENTLSSGRTILTKNYVLTFTLEIKDTNEDNKVIDSQGLESIDSVIINMYLGDKPIKGIKLTDFNIKPGIENLKENISVILNLNEEEYKEIIESKNNTLNQIDDNYRLHFEIQPIFKNKQLNQVYSFLNSYFSKINVYKNDFFIESIYVIDNTTFKQAIIDAIGSVNSIGFLKNNTTQILPQKQKTQNDSKNTDEQEPNKKTLRDILSNNDFKISVRPSFSLDYNLQKGQDIDLFIYKRDNSYSSKFIEAINPTNPNNNIVIANILPENQNEEIDFKWNDKESCSQLLVYSVPGQQGILKAKTDLNILRMGWDWFLFIPYYHSKEIIKAERIIDAQPFNTKDNGLESIMLAVQAYNFENHRNEDHLLLLNYDQKKNNKDQNALVITDILTMPYKSIIGLGETRIDDRKLDTFTQALPNRILLMYQTKSNDYNSGGKKIAFLDFLVNESKYNHSPDNALTSFTNASKDSNGNMSNTNYSNLYIRAVRIVNINPNSITNIEDFYMK
ncbi:MAG: hypothetical protein GWP09_00350 [Nitrospiraceae bacterium]|nr:hypothetical protein [Nitrospiraceae bacterium]